MTNYSVDDEFGNQITTGLHSYEAAKHVARRYLCAHDDAPMARIYTDEGDESQIWDVTLADVS